MTKFNAGQHPQATLKPRHEAATVSGSPADQGRPRGVTHAPRPRTYNLPHGGTRTWRRGAARERK